ncbi:MAG: efflux RND transporter periplasmic adaptor subunit, partial [Planctomycetaceae bacterium]|nr:efflux RND transporter periplasmic adaptor subunit [Planctomycetaceae bacterium]
LAAVIGLLYGFRDRFLPAQEEQAAAETDEYDSPKAASEEPREVVELPSGKLEAAKIQTEPVAVGSITHSHTVPARLTYNDNRHIEVTTPSNGIVLKLFVKPGDQVAAGQTLCWINSPEIGSARADVLQRRADLALKQSLEELTVTLEKNVKELTASLKENPNFDSLRSQFGKTMLGDYRDSLLGAYSRLKLAESVVSSVSGLENSGALAGKTIKERQAAVESGQAELASAIEQAELDVWTARTKAAAETQDAQRRVKIAEQHLASLLLNLELSDPMAPMPDSSEMGAVESDLEHLSQVEIKAPFAGTIEQRTYSVGERIHAGDSLFVLADTSTLWVEAEIREGDWAAVSIQPNQELQVTIPAMDNATFPATVEYIGRQVSLETNAVPIIAKIENKDGRLRPGLFARVSIPIGTHNDVCMVMAQSVLQHDGQDFLFIQEAPNRFRRKNVTVGIENETQLEILSGVAANEPVVTDGAFLLKSELLLESEEE